MHSNCGKINETVEICMELFFRAIDHMLLVVLLGNFLSLAIRSRLISLYSTTIHKISNFDKG